jgi:glycosyltransferase involved in cell wall biosynthesis
MHQPLISCLTVTTDRIRLLRQAVGCYLAQTWSARELVIVAGGSVRYQDAVSHYCAQLGRDDIRVIRALPGQPLGAMRNLSLDNARGAFVCQWDDDDLYHPERLRLQYESLAAAGADACFLTETLQFFDDARELYWLDWAFFDRPGADGVRMVPGSMLVRRDARLRYPDTERGEDNAIRDLVFRTMKPVGLDGHGFLYVYRFLGRNVWPRRHHHGLSETAIEPAVLAARAHTLRRALAAYPLPLPYAVKARHGQTVFLYDGPRPGDETAVVAAQERPAW